VTAAAVVLAGTLAWLLVEWRQSAVRAETGASHPALVLPGPRREQAAQAEQAALAAASKRQAEWIGTMLGRARQAVAGERYDLAAAAARSVLMLDPGDAEAQAILAALPKPQEVPAVRPAPVPKPPRAARNAVSRPVSLPILPVRPPPPVAPVPTDAKLHVHLFSEMSSGILMVYMGEKQLLRDEFDFSQKKALFWHKPGQGFSDSHFTIPAGTTKLRVYLTPSGQAARVQEVTGNFPGGSQRRLEIKLDRDGVLTAHLE
jgi:hypothetical protein